MVRRSSRISHKPIKVQKYFDAGWFEGEVKSSREDEEDGETLYLIVYEDGDKEEVDDDELKVLKENFKHDRKNLAIDEEYIIVDDSSDEDGGLSGDEDGAEAEAEGEDDDGPPKKIRKKASSENGKEKRKGKKNQKQEAGQEVAEEEVVASHTCENSSLWDTLNPVDGATVDRDLIASKVAEDTPSEEQLPLELQHRLPEMVEFFVLMMERQLIYNGKKTKCEILEHYHFCNNYRELDRGTAYLRSEILRVLQPHVNPMSKLEYTKEVLAMSYYYRQCNLIESFKNKANPVGGIPRFGQFPKFAKYVKRMEKEKKLFFTCAHFTQGFDKYIGYCKSSDAMIEEVARKITDLEEFDMKQICKQLMRLGGIATFLGWQIACDLEEACCFGPKLRKNNQSAVLEEVELLPDNYCVLGPGAKKGLNKIFGEDVIFCFKKKNGGGTMIDLALYLRDNMEYCLGLVESEFPLWKNRKVSLKVIEHVLCEYQKFVQIDSGYTQGQRKRRSRAKEMDKKPKGCKGEVFRCDTCHLIAERDNFERVRDEEGGGWNCCHRCHVMDQLDLVD